MKLKIFKKGFNYSQDGPGNRIVLHLQGCNMHCPWCANPEGMDVKGVLIIDPDSVLDTICSKAAIRDGIRNTEICDQCTIKECISADMRNLGIQLSYKEYELKDIVNMVTNCDGLFYDGGGSYIKWRRADFAV